MRKLLSAEGSRLMKSKVLWIGVAAVFAYGVYAYALSYFLQKSTGKIDTVDEYFFNHLIMMGVLTAVFISLFIGTEYNEGTMRNKLIVGHKRSDVYLSELLGGFLAGTFLWASYFLAAFVVGMPLLGFFKKNTGMMAYYMLCGLLLTFAYVSIMVLCSMLNSNKSLNAVLCMLLAMGLLLLTVLVSVKLEAPEMISNSYIMSINGEMLPQEPYPNPQYVTGAMRAFYEWVLDILPSGQAVQIANFTGGLYPERWPFCSLAIIAVSTGTGLAVFRRKDIN